MIYFTAHTFNCVCHCIRVMFRVLGMYNFDSSSKIDRKSPVDFATFAPLHVYSKLHGY